MLAGLLVAALAGAAIPFGGWLGTFDAIDRESRFESLRHGIVAFGAGALLSAIAFVLVPEGADRIAPLLAPLLVVLGGLAFAVIDRALARQGGHAAQFLAMLLDFLPEALALGAMLSGNFALAMLLGAMIAMQNIPEGFNAFRELHGLGHMPARRILLLFCAVVPLGPLMAWAGMSWLHPDSAFLGAVMLFAAGGILYLIFEDIAPLVWLERAWAPPFGAVCGFALGFAGHLLLG